MHILIVAATPFEIAPLYAWLQKEFSPVSDNVFSSGDIHTEILITGPGLPATAFFLGRRLALRPVDLVVNAGICGAIDRKLAIGEAVLVREECFADIGAETADGAMLDLFDLKLMDINAFPYQNGKLRIPAPDDAHFLPGVSGISVNKATGSEAGITRLVTKYPEAQVESMEGAAVFLACLYSGVKFLEIRTVSNYVEPRNRENWNIPLAITNLNDTLINMIRSFAEGNQPAG